MHITLLYLSLALKTIQFFSASKVLPKLFFPLSFRFLITIGISVFNLLNLLIAFDNSINSLLKEFFLLLISLKSYFVVYFYHFCSSFLLHPYLKCRCSKTRAMLLALSSTLSTHFLYKIPSNLLAPINISIMTNTNFYFCLILSLEHQTPVHNWLVKTL